MTTLKTIKSVAIGLLSVVAVSSFASETDTQPSKADIRAAEQKLKQTFANYQITDFKPSPIPGIYEVQAGSQVHYWAKEQGILIFGQMWSSEGVNLTEKSKQASIQNRLDGLPLDSAVTIQEGEIPIIEISNPDCGYCKRYEQWVESLDSVYSIERKVVFYPEIFPAAEAKLRAVLCANNRRQAYKDMVAGKYKPVDCEAATAILADHKRITDALGVGGTPTFLLPDGSVITGFKQKELESYFLKAANSSKED